MEAIKIDGQDVRIWNAHHKEYISDFEVWCLQEVARQFYNTPHEQTFFCDGMLNLMENGHLKEPKEVLWLTTNGNVVFETISDEGNEIFGLKNF